MNATEQQVWDDLMELFADRLGNAGCNDLGLPDSEEGRAMHRAIWDHGGDGPENYDEPKPGERPITYDYMALSYLLALVKAALAVGKGNNQP